VTNVAFILGPSAVAGGNAAEFGVVPVTAVEAGTAAPPVPPAFVGTLLYPLFPPTRSTVDGILWVEEEDMK